MIELTQDGGAPVDVTFRVPSECGAKAACVVGEFNDWSTTAHPMEPDGDGFMTTITLPPGRTYRFRYLLDGERWENDWAAHAYVPNEFGGDDSLLDLTSATPDTASSGNSPAKPANRRRRARASEDASAPA
jgi:1,4-alpha-glucan branching enzyme